MGIKGARFLLGEKLKHIKVTDNGVIVELESGKRVRGDALLYTVGRKANTDGLNLESIDVQQTKRGLLFVNDNYQTSHDHMYVISL